MQKQAVDDPAEPAFWAARWQRGETGWDQGQAYPCLAELLDAARAAGHLSPGSSVLEPSAGRAHTGAELARLGFEVTSFDVVPEAVAAARALYGAVPRLKLEVADALVVRPDWLGRFQGLFDRAALCALPPARREDYARAAFAHLAPGGVILSSVVTERRVSPEGGPPFAVSAEALTRMLSPGFERIYARVRELPEATSANVKSELLSVWRRRDLWAEGR